MSFDAATLANPTTRVLRAYDPGHDLPTLRARFGELLAELGSNETVLGPSPRALTAMSDALAETFRYPDPQAGALKRALAEHWRIESSRIALGNGSHELLMLLAQCFADPETSVVFPEYGFAVFPIATAAVGAIGIRANALPGDHATAPYGHDLDALAAAVREDTKLVYLANPNNPTGTWFSDAELEGFLARVAQSTLVVVDEAYQEFVDAPGAGSAIRLLDSYPNLVVTRTFSKAHALAGLRIGYLLADASVVDVIERLRESFNVNMLAQVAALAALADAEHLEKVCRWTRSEREWLSAELDSRGYRVLPSQTNFVLVVLDHDAGSLEQHLFKRGVIVRPMGGYGLGHCIRISLGTRAENERLLAALP
ncbi:MAG TPA: histidinol-phosphate transaminase [Dokdonella sp.]|uniref:histidinol-phosphate transaminase n=1 Tax=Dokdonella sp. TaxID=2291710 RepID=UPI002D8056C2|nr:histidinol-phosphate transaminase [Dokdonella sp.]HET9031951.1 histidinol-phosphate transaminase [Dokdonella sp.]